MGESSTVNHCEGSITYVEFLENYLKPNRPVVLGRDLVSSWPAFHLWTISTTACVSSGVIPSAEGQRENSEIINWGYLSHRYGDHEVSVSDCQKVDSFGNLESTSVKFKDVVAQWQREEGQSLYVKDWHLARVAERQQGEPYAEDFFYTTPDIFKDDWMNAFYTAHTTDDFRFVYVGAAGTLTPLHRDVYCSYSWSTNICGRKRWWLFPPEQTPYLFMKERRVAVHDVRQVDIHQFPEFYKAVPAVVDQEAGETIFVPSGWYHQVENLTECISINHNWCNSVNLLSLYSSMCAKVEEVELALEDVREMLSSAVGDNWQREFTAVVQDLVKQDAGWNWLTFWKMVTHALRAISAPVRGSPKSGVDLHCFLFPHALAHERPSTSFVLNNISVCYENFMRRERLECVNETLAVLEEVKTLLASNASLP